MADAVKDFITLLESDPRQKARTLINAGWRVFYAALFGESFVEGLDSEETDDCHHSEAIEWHWKARLALLRGERPPGDWFVYFPTWARGNMKTTIGRAMLVTDAILSWAHHKSGYALIPGGSSNKIKTHASSIEAMLHSPRVVAVCPLLSRVKRNEMGRSRGWTATYIHTEAGYVFHFLGIEQGMAGANIEGVRPTFIQPDDIDSRDDSPLITERKFRALTWEILPSRQADTLVYWAQNIISRYSVRYRIEKQHVAVLTNRKPTQPVPAVRGLKVERRLVDGIWRDVVIDGRCTWRRWNLQRVQDEIDTYGLTAFLREAQHEVEQTNLDLMVHTWDDRVHVISESEFALVYGTRRMPASWMKEWGSDWARTKTSRHANVALWRTISPPLSPLPGMQFIFYPMSFPANSQPEDVAERILGCLEQPKGTTWQQMRRDALARVNAVSFTRTQLERIEYEQRIMEEIFPPLVVPVLEKHHCAGGVNSHEREDVRRIFNAVYGMRCTGVNPKKFGGIEQINRDFYVDYSLEHPFRPGESGYTRTFLVVPDDPAAEEEERVVAGRRGVVRRPVPFMESVMPEELEDHDLFRFQMVNWRTRPAKLTEMGEIIDIPEKANDDFGNVLQMLAVGRPLQVRPLEPAEEFQMLLPDRVRETKQKMKDGFGVTKEEQQQMETARYFAYLELLHKYGDKMEDEDFVFDLDKDVAYLM